MTKNSLSVNRQIVESYLHSLTDYNLELYMEYMKLCGNCGDIRHLIGFPIGFPSEQIPPLYSYETDLARRIRKRWQMSPMTNLDLPDSIIKLYSPNAENEGHLFAVLFAYWLDLPKEQLDLLADSKRCRYLFQLLRHFLYLSESKDEKQLRKCPYSGECIYSSDTYFVFGLPKPDEIVHMMEGQLVIDDIEPPYPNERTAHFVDGRLVIDETREVMDIL